MKEIKNKRKNILGIKEIKIQECELSLVPVPPSIWAHRKQTKTNNMYTSGKKDTNKCMDISNSVGTRATTGTPETAGSQTASETPA